MKTGVLVMLLTALVCSSALGGGLADSAGVIRVFGDGSSWMTCCFVVGDGSWVVTPYDAVTEKISPQTEQAVRYPLYISPYTGRAYQCELKASDKDLNIALLKLPISGLPAAPLVAIGDFSKAGYGTMGQLTSGEPQGLRWPTDIYAIAREKSGAANKLSVVSWDARKAFVTDIGKFKWVFVSEMSPERPIPNGAMVARDTGVAGMYVNRLVITGGKQSVIFGRCVMSTEIAKFLGAHGVGAASLSAPPAPTVRKADDADAAFQLQARIYAFIGAGKPALAVDSALALVKMRPKDAEGQMALGVALAGTGKFDDALKAFDEAAKIDPSLPVLRTNRAITLVGLKRRDEAEKELLKAVEEAPGDVRPTTAAADFYLGDAKTYDKALTYAKKAVTMAPNSPAALLLQAKAEKCRRQYTEAIKSIDDALKLAPGWTAAWYALGSTYEESGDKVSAESAYRKLVALQPKTAEPLVTLASFLADNGKTDEATELIAKIRQLTPSKDILDAAKAIEDRIKGKPAS